MRHLWLRCALLGAVVAVLLSPLAQAVTSEGKGGRSMTSGHAMHPHGMPQQRPSALHEHAAPPAMPHMSALGGHALPSHPSPMDLLGGEDEPGHLQEEVSHAINNSDMDDGLGSLMNAIAGGENRESAGLRKEAEEPTTSHHHDLDLDEVDPIHGPAHSLSDIPPPAQSLHAEHPHATASHGEDEDAEDEDEKHESEDEDEKEKVAKPEVTHRRQENAGTPASAAAPASSKNNGWERVDTTDGRAYYWNKQTGATSWEDPNSPAQAQTAEAAAATAVGTASPQHQVDLDRALEESLRDGNSTTSGSAPQQQPQQISVTPSSSSTSNTTVQQPASSSAQTQNISTSSQVNQTSSPSPSSSAGRKTQSSNSTAAAKTEPATPIVTSPVAAPAPTPTPAPVPAPKPRNEAPEHKAVAHSGNDTESDCGKFLDEHSWLAVSHLFKSQLGSLCDNGAIGGGKNNTSGRTFLAACVRPGQHCLTELHKLDTASMKWKKLPDEHRPCPFVFGGCSFPSTNCFDSISTSWVELEASTEKKTVNNDHLRGMVFAGCDISEDSEQALPFMNIFDTFKQCRSSCVHGVVEDGVCRCYEGYDGPSCDQVVRCPGNCNERGICSHGQCFCAPGFSGADCSTTVHCANDCSKNGVCFDGKCYCNPGFSGDDCSVEKSCPGDCSGHGVCKHGLCFCDAGHAGPSCNGTLPGVNATQEHMRPREEYGAGPWIHSQGNGGFHAEMIHRENDPSIPAIHRKESGDSAHVWLHAKESPLACFWNCSGNGVCRDGSCFCATGWTGLDCGTSTDVLVDENCVSYGNTCGIAVGTFIVGVVAGLLVKLWTDIQMKKRLDERAREAKEEIRRREHERLENEAIARKREELGISDSDGDSGDDIENGSLTRPLVK